MVLINSGVFLGALTIVLVFLIYVFILFLVTSSFLTKFAQSMWLLRTINSMN